MTSSEVRRLGALTELVHAVVYFAPQVGQAYRDVGLKGFWRGYFAGRSAALGAASPQLVTALFAGFAPAMVERALWHDCTVLREHRGDGHVAAVTASRLRWPEPHLLLAGLGRLDPRQQEHRGWSDDEWGAARERLVARGLLAADGTATPGGERVYVAVEELTAELATPAYDVVDRAALTAVLEPLAARVVAAEAVPFPNAMGLPRLI